MVFESLVFACSLWHGTGSLRWAADSHAKLFFSIFLSLPTLFCPRYLFLGRDKDPNFIRIAHSWRKKTVATQNYKWIGHGIHFMVVVLLSHTKLEFGVFFLNLSHPSSSLCSGRGATRILLLKPAFEWSFFEYVINLLLNEPAFEWSFEF